MNEHYIKYRLNNMSIYYKLLLKTIHFGVYFLICLRGDAAAVVVVPDIIIYDSNNKDYLAIATGWGEGDGTMKGENHYRTSCE